MLSLAAVFHLRSPNCILDEYTAQPFPNKHYPQKRKAASGETETTKSRKRKRKNAASKTSLFRGVSWNKQSKKWKVVIRVHGKQKGLGYFTDEVEAAHAYDAYAIANDIDVPRNFPNEDEDAVVAEAERGRAAKKRKKAASKS